MTPHPAESPAFPVLLRFGPFEIDVRTGELTKHGRRIRLQDQPARLLIFLASRPGGLVTREEIQIALWPDGQFVEFDHAINTAIRKVRAALGDESDQPRWIETLPRKGYRFIGPVERVAPEAADSSSPPTAEAPDSPFSPSSSGDALIGPRAAWMLFLVIQAGYLAIYSAALLYLGGVESGLNRLGVEPAVGLPTVVLGAMCGIAVRLYLASSIGLRHPEAGGKFLSLFPVLLLLDGFWAASPLLAAETIGFGPALAAAAGLAYLPFSQRTLVRNIYVGAA